MRLIDPDQGCRARQPVITRQGHQRILAWREDREQAHPGAVHNILLEWQPLTQHLVGFRQKQSIDLRGHQLHIQVRQQTGELDLQRAATYPIFHRRDHRVRRTGRPPGCELGRQFRDVCCRLVSCEFDLEWEERQPPVHWIHFRNQRTTVIDPDQAFQRRLNTQDSIDGSVCDCTARSGIQAGGIDVYLGNLAPPQ